LGNICILHIGISKGGWGLSKTKTFNIKRNVSNLLLLEFPEGWGVVEKIPSVGGMDIFWNYNEFKAAFLCQVELLMF